MTDVQSPEQHAQEHLVHVTLSESVDKEVPAGRTQVSVLMVELGVDPADMLFRIDGNGRKQPLSAEDVIEVHDGERFEAIRGGGVS